MATDAERFQDVVDLERRFWLEGGGEPDFWRRHFADDGLVALPFGVMDKDQTIAAMAEDLPWAHVEMDDLRAVALTDASVALAYTAAGTRDGDPVPYRAVIGSTYVHRDGGWQLAFHQQTPLDDAAA